MSDNYRSLESFGVAGVLTKDANVFYTNDLRARNVGRVSDLISAKFRDSEVDELRLRALLLFSLFQTYSIRGLPLRHQEEVSPVIAEIGIDGSKIAVAVSFHWEIDRVPSWSNLGSRIDQKLSSDSFEKGFEWCREFQANVIIRYEETERRIEVISVFDSQAQDTVPTEVIRVGGEIEMDLEVSSYTELGDLEFSTLLKNPSKTDSFVVTGEIPIADESLKVDALLETIQSLETRLVASEKKAEEAILVKGNSNAGENKGEWGLSFLKKVWPFAKSEEEKVDSVLVKGASPEQEVESIRVKSKPVEPQVDEVQVIEAGPTTEMEIESEQTLKALQEIAKPKNSKVIESTLEEINAEAEPEKAKRWVDSLSKEILQEKAKLNELQRNLAKQMRQRELEFKTSEHSLKQEIKRKEELLNQRQSIIDNKSEQIAQLNLAVERAASGTSDKESLQLKSKLERAQRLAQMKEDESKGFSTKVRDLENRLIIAQAKAQKGSDLQSAAKIQNLEKKIDEYKRINQRLMESLNAQKEKSSDKEVGDLRRKVDQLDRMNIEAKKNLEKANFKLREIHETERKLQTDLARAVEENRMLRKQSARGGGESGGQAA